jgi:nucleoside-diphosphate-sugar epimerase
MRVFITGGTGFTGSRVVPLLLKDGYQVRCLHRPQSDRSFLPQSEIEWVEGDLSAPQTLASLMKGCNALINLASLGLGHADSIVHATQEAGIWRGIFLSTTAIYTQLNARSKSIRLAAEQTIQTSGLEYTVLRPTMIYGSPRDRNMWRLVKFLRVSPLVPIFGSGNHLQQPVYVDDVAQAIISCLFTNQTIGRNYNIAGKFPLTYINVVDTITRKLGKRVWKLHIPSEPVAALLGFLERFHIPFPIRAEQVLRLNEDKSFSYEDAQMDFGFSPLSFDDGIARELEGKQK